MKRVLCLALVMLLFAGCTPQENQVTPSPTATASKAPVELPKVEKETAQGREAELTWSVAWPVLRGTGENEAFEKINEVLAGEAREYERRAKGELRSYAAGERRRMEAEGEAFSPHTYQRTFTVTYEKGNFLSVLEEEYGFEGGAYPSAGRCAHTFDLGTGEETPLHEVLGLSREEAEKLVEERFAALIQQEPELYLPGVQERLPELMDRMDFYLEEGEDGADQAVVYFPTDTLAPRALGFPQLSLQIEKNS